MENKYRLTKFACYTTNIAMSVVANLSPLLFLTFRHLYAISYSLLGSLVLINFFTQLLIDLIFSFFSHKFNIEKTVKFTPVLTVIGLAVYALAPVIFKDSVFLGLSIGTVLFSASGGLAEVLISPTIAAIPAKDPDKEMSKLHSIYAWGVVFVVIFSTLFLLVFGQKSWQYLAAVFAIIPLISALLFRFCEMPEMSAPEKASGTLNLLKNKQVWGSVFAIFLGGAAECTMAQWSSGFLEQALGIPKLWGDIFGVALFSVALGLGRSMYAKVGKHIEKVILTGAVGAVLCYLITALCPIPFVGLLACAFTGFCVSMMWPGNLIIASEKFPNGGVVIFALMAAGGDMGASVGPQLIGIITDFAIENLALVSLANRLNLAPEQLGMKAGMLIGMLFPLIAIPLYYSFFKTKNKKS